MLIDDPPIRIHPLMRFMPDNHSGWMPVKRAFVPLPWILAVNPPLSTNSCYSLFANGVDSSDAFLLFTTCVSCGESGVFAGMAAFEFIHISNCDHIDKIRYTARVICKKCLPKYKCNNENLDPSKSNIRQQWIRKTYTANIISMLRPLLDQIVIPIEKCKKPQENSCLMCEKPLGKRKNPGDDQKFCSVLCTDYYQTMNEWSGISTPEKNGQSLISVVFEEIKKRCVYDYIDGCKRTCTHCGEKSREYCKSCRGIEHCSKKCERIMKSWHSTACHDWKKESWGKLVFICE